MPRPKGSKNKATLEREQAVKEGGMTPLEYLLSVFRNEESDSKERLDAAKAAAPYVHPRLAAVEHSGEIGNGKPVKEMSDEELLHIIAGRSRDGNVAKEKGEAQLH